MTHELLRNQSAKEEDSKKKRTFAPNIVDESKDNAKSSNSQKKDELALTTREFKKILRKRRNFRRRKALNKGDPSKEKEKEKDNQVTCYGCKRPGHYKYECLQLKKVTKNHKKKAMIATWRESDDSSSQLEE